MMSLIWILILILLFVWPILKKRNDKSQGKNKKDSPGTGPGSGPGSENPFNRKFENEQKTDSGNAYEAGPGAGYHSGPGGSAGPAPKRRGFRNPDRNIRFPFRKILISAAVVIIVLILAFGSFYSVSEQENAVVTQFGKIVRTDTAGLYFKIPFLQRVRMVDITTHGTGVGYTVSDTGQNITDDGDGIMITSDFNLLNIDFYLEYKVDDPVAYLYYSEDPEGILKNIALASIRSVVSNYSVDDAMTTGKSQIQADVKETMMQELEQNDIGLQVVNITVQDSEPPTDEIKQAFKAVETAKQGADTARNNALQYQNSKLPQAEAEADKIIQDATAAKDARIAEASGQVSRFNAEYKEYIKFPDVTKKRMFYETMEDILPDLKVIVTDGDTQTLLPLDDFSGSSNAAADSSENDTSSEAALNRTNGGPDA